MSAEGKYKLNFKVWIPVILWMVVIFSFSAQPASESSQLSGRFTQIILNMLEMTPIPQMIGRDLMHVFIRKTAHFSIYAVLGILTLKAIGEKTRQAWQYAWIICVLYAVSDEFHQVFVPGRSAQGKDVIIDSIGALVGICLVVFIRKRGKNYE